VRGVSLISFACVFVVMSAYLACLRACAWCSRQQACMRVCSVECVFACVHAARACVTVRSTYVGQAGVLCLLPRLCLGIQKASLHACLLSRVRLCMRACCARMRACCARMRERAQRLCEHAYALCLLARMCAGNQTASLHACLLC
jgi:hypothetical protein